MKGTRNLCITIIGIPIFMVLGTICYFILRNIDESERNSDEYSTARLLSLIAFILLIVAIVLISIVSLSTLGIALF